MGADSYSPPTSVNPGSVRQPGLLEAGSSAAIADLIFLASDHVAPGESRLRVLDVVGVPPSAASNRGRLARIRIDDETVVALSDGFAWRVLTAGEIL